MKKILIFILPLVITACIVYASIKLTSGNAIFVSNFENFSKKISETAETTIQETTEAPVSITLSFVGDCLLATDARTSYSNSFEDVANRESPEYFFSKVSHIFLNDDFTVADCENVFSDSDNLTMADKGQHDDPDVEAYWFKYKTSGSNILKVGGVDMVSVDNNHINDYGWQGHTDTEDALDAAGVLWGEAGKIVYYKKDGYKIAVICFSMYSSYQAELGMKHLEKAKKKSDYQVIYFHGGKEAVHQPEQWKIDACHNFIDNGADLIMGDHPHVLQPREIYKGKTIIYSLGNFVFGGNRHPENRTIIYQHTLTLAPDKTLLSEAGTIIPCYVYTGDINNWQPAIIEDQETKQKVLDFMDGKTDSPL